MFHFSVTAEAIPHATGIEKWELMAAQAGNDVSWINISQLSQWYYKECPWTNSTSRLMNLVTLQLIDYMPIFPTFKNRD